MSLESSFGRFTIAAEGERSSLEREKIVKELEAVGGNKLYFKEYGLEESSEAGIAPEILEELDGEAASFTESALECFKDYLAGPIFTDDFHEDHPSRRQWEAENIMVGISAEAKNYYDSNRLNIHMFYPAIEYLKDISEEIAEGNLQNELRHLLTEIPADLSERVKYSEDEDSVIKYCLLPDSGKIKAITEFTKIIEKAVGLLEKNIV